MTFIGLHGRADGPQQDADLACMTTARVEAVKLLSTAAGADVDHIGQRLPAARFVVRCFADFRGRWITAADFARSMAGDLVPFYQRGLRDFEIHNEPNLLDEGWRSTWADGAGFGVWFNDVRLALSNTFPGCRWGWPGLSPGPTEGSRTDSEQFMAAAGEHVLGADWIGLHCYWIDEQTYADALHQVQLVRARYPGKVIRITEFANPDPGTPPAVKAQQYLRFYRDCAGLAESAFAFVASASAPDFAAQAWRDEAGRLGEIPAIVGARQEPSMTTVTYARGIDVSGDNQFPGAMRFGDWAKLGFCYGWVEWTNGTRLVPHAAEHRQLMLAANYLTGGYANLRADDKSPETQCDVFLDNCPWDGFIDFLDAELRNLKEPMIRAWVNRWLERKQQRALLVYTGKGAWELIVPAAARSFYSNLFGLVEGSYPFDTPPDAQGVDRQPMDAASVARRSTPPADRVPDLPLTWTPDQLFSWQHTGHGSLPGYNGFLDLHVATVTQAELRARFSGQAAPAPGPTPTPAQPPAPAFPIDETPTGFKLFPGQVGNGIEIDICRSAKAAGAPFRASFGMDNAGLAINAFEEQLTTYQLTRIVQGATDACPGLDAEPGKPALTSAQMKAMAYAQIVAYQRLNDREKLLDGNGKARVKILPWNEPAPATRDGHLRLAELMSYTVEASAAAGFHCLVFCWNAGTPQADYWRAICGTGINELLLATGNGICFHFGVLGQPGIPDSVSDTVNDSLLQGVDLFNKDTGYHYFLPNADALVLRHRMFKRIAAEEGRPIAPLWGTELYVLLKGIADYAPAEVVRRLAWVDKQLALDDEVVGGFPYAIGTVGVGLPRNDHTKIWPLLIPVAVSVKNRINATRKEKIVAITQEKKQRMHEAATVIVEGAQGLLAEIDALVVDDAPAPANWWDAWPAGVFPKRPLATPAKPITMRDAAGNPLAGVKDRQNALDAFERRGDLFRVLDAPLVPGGPLWWVKAEDLPVPTN